MQLSCLNHFDDHARTCAQEIPFLEPKSAKNDFDEFFGRKTYDIRTFAASKSVDFACNQLKLRCLNHFDDHARTCVQEIQFLEPKSAKHDFDEFFGRKTYDIRTFAASKSV